jgi:hypothetical protein
MSGIFRFSFQALDAHENILSRHGRRGFEANQAKKKIEKMIDLDTHDRLSTNSQEKWDTMPVLLFAGFRPRQYFEPLPRFLQVTITFVTGTRSRIAL